MSVKHQALPQIQTTRPPLLELFAIMTGWERMASALVLVATLACLIVLVVLLI